MRIFKSLSQVMNELRARGYTKDYNIAFDKLHCTEDGSCLNPHEFEIVETHRFDGYTNPDDESVLYAIESIDGSRKGIFVSGYGLYDDGLSQDMLQKLRYNPSNEQKELPENQ